MQLDRVPSAARYAKQNSRRRIWRKIVQFMACIVVFCTTYALILPAITQENDVFCGMDTHVHDASCFVRVDDPAIAQLVCTYETLGLHRHDEDCFDAEGNFLCGMADYVIHSHSAVCFNIDEELICQLPEKEAHEHTEACYKTILVNPVTEEPVEEEQEELIEEDQNTEEEAAPVETHVHGADCYAPERGDLTCTITDLGHTHSTACYQAGTELCCNMEENHVHSESCYEIGFVCGLGDTEDHIHEMDCYGTTDALLCKSAEGHIHTDACYVPELICPDTERAAHKHGDSCYAWTEVLICEAEETETVVSFADVPEEALPDEEIYEEETDLENDASVYEAVQMFICSEPEAEVHIHDSNCFAVLEQNEACTLEENEEHTHTFLCEGGWASVCGKETHQHTLACYADITADVEETEDWEKTFARVELTGVWTEDLLAIAETQLGYVESTENYIVLEDGETTMPYTRYGAWYGDPYAEWNTLFVYFCLDYAGVENMPFAENANRWKKALDGEELYFEAGETEPQPGWLMFIDSDLDGRADQVAIVAEVSLTDPENTGLSLLLLAENEADSVTVIQGDVTSRVQNVTYDLTDETILGYSMLPEQINEALQQVINLIDELPSAEEIEQQIALFEEAEDLEGKEVWLNEVYTQVQAAYAAYNALTEEEQTAVTNADKLMELEDLRVAAENAQKVQQVIDLIDGLPSADEIDEQIALYEEAEDYDGEEAWLSTVYQQVAEAYYYYSQLTEEEQAAVSNADKLMELEYIWSVETYSGRTIVNTTPGTVDGVSTSEFITLNLYDYLGDKSSDSATAHINTKYLESNLYPGFPWGGGVVLSTDSTSNPANTAHIEFGNSIMTDWDYPAGTNNEISRVDGTINGIHKEYNSSGVAIDWCNRPVGMSLNDYGDAATTSNDTLARILTPGGYPALTKESDKNTQGGTLAYLFGGVDNASDYVKKQNTGSIDGLFQYNTTTGMYYYNSRQNHAEYILGEDRFILYKATITPNFLVYPFGNFMPFNKMYATNDKNSKAMNLGALTSGQLKYYLGQDNISVLNDKIIAAEAKGESLPSEEMLHTALGLYRKALNGGSSGDTVAGSLWDTWSAKDAILYYLQKNPLDSTTNTPDLSHVDTLYNIDYDEEKNFYFGMDMSMELLMPKNGKTGPDGDQDMVFKFAGDDDVWVYLDGMLFLDLSGLHRHVGGLIDFTKGLVKYFELDPTTGDLDYNNPYQIFTFRDLATAALTYKYEKSGTVSENLTGTALTEKVNEELTKLFGTGNTFLDYSTHSFKFFYMERGAGSSVCQIEFNFPMLRENTLSVTKKNTTTTGTGIDDVNGDPDYYFNIMDEDNKSLFIGSSTSTTGITQYKVMDEAGNILKDSNNQDLIFTIEEDDYGIFTLKEGQTAVFEGISELAGGFYVQELIKEQDKDQYPSVFVNDADAIGSGGLIEWNYRAYFASSTEYNASNPTVGPEQSKWYGYSSNPIDAGSSSSFYFEQQNRVDTGALGSLTICKELSQEAVFLTNETFRIYVDLDGTVNTYDLAPGASVTIENILSGTKFTVWEDSDSAENYVVTYSQENADDVSVLDGTGISGVVRANTQVSVTVTNAKVGARVIIPGTKRVLNPDGTPRDYTFTMVQVTDDTGATVFTPEDSMEPVIYSATASSVDDETVDFAFTLSYLVPDLDEVPATFYYRITEDPADYAAANDTVYLVTVTVTEDGATYTMKKGVMAAVVDANHNVTGYEPNFAYAEPVTTAAFENILVGDLKLSKRVLSDNPGAQGFRFTILLNEGTSGILPQYTYPIDGFSWVDGELKQVWFDNENVAFNTHTLDCTCCVARGKNHTLCEDCGACISCSGGEDCKGEIWRRTVFSGFMDGEYIVIKDIPIGTTWAIAEDPATSVGYAVTYKVTVNDGTHVSGTGNTAQAGESGIVLGLTEVAFTNTIMYELPETGGGGCMNYWMGGGLLMSVPLLCSFRRRRCGRKRVIGR